MGEKKMQESAAVWNTVSKAMQLNFANCIQDVNNVIAIVRANREDSKEALIYLERAHQVYQEAINICKLAETPDVKMDTELSEIDRFLL
jgi:hypothetical protein